MCSSSEDRLTLQGVQGPVSLNTFLIKHTFDNNSILLSCITRLHSSYTTVTHISEDFYYKMQMKL